VITCFVKRQVASLAHLVAERQQETDSINLQDGMYAPLSSLQILENMFRKELDHVHLGISRRHAMLHPTQEDEWEISYTTLYSCKQIALTCVVDASVAIAVNK
jgi:hypothetical protein